MGAFCLVLHTHLPYVRRNGVWPSGEDFFHQAALECYLPLLGVLERLADDGLRDALTLGVSPMVAHQMSDAHMMRELAWYLGMFEVRTWQQAAGYDGIHREQIRDLAAFYARWAREQADRLDRIGDLASGFDAVARAGVVELLGGPATHPYLPLLREPALAEAQVALGRAEHERVFGRSPAGMWLPECAYSPDAGIEDLLDRHGVQHIVVDGPTMLRSGGSTFAPALVGPSNVVALARNLDVTYRVWSPTGGYPTNKWYRDFFHYDTEGGFKDWRVTSVRKPLEQKQPYEPDAAAARARTDAADMLGLIERTLADHRDATGREGLVLAAYDTELFGHWWFEGPIFLEELMRLAARSETARPMSLARALEHLPEPQAVEFQAGSWGFRKDERSWLAPETEWMWQALEDVERATVKLARAAGANGGDLADQLVRECMLLQASDWPFMVLRGRNPDYASERFTAHRERWQRCADLLAGEVDPDVARPVARELFEVDNILPDRPSAVLR